MARVLGDRPLTGRLLVVAAAWTWFVWLNRLVNMAGEERTTGFVVVHVTIAVVSLLLALPVAVVGWRMARRRPPA